MRVTPKKHLGQHFLIDENIARKIIGFLNPAIPTVLEVGPGKGVLSKYLLDNPSWDPWFIEIDRESVEYLSHTYPSILPRLIRADVLSFNLRSWHTGNTASDNQVVAPDAIQLLGNFPYNISSGILFFVMEHRDIIREVTGMFQREVAQRIAAPPGSKRYGILSVLLQAFFDIEYRMTVGESVFYPPPNVQSAILQLKRNTMAFLGCDEKSWILLVKTAFNQRRKMLRNSLSSLMPEKVLQNGDPIWHQRPEQLGWADFVALTRMREEAGEENC